MIHVFILLSVFFTTVIVAEDNNGEDLLNLDKSIISLDQKIELKRKEVEKSKSEDEKKQLNEELDELNKEQRSMLDRFEEIAAGINISSLQDNEDKSLSVSEEFQELLRPLIVSAKESTKGMRAKTALMDEIEEHQDILPKAKLAEQNLAVRIKNTTDDNIKQKLIKLHEEWQRQVELTNSKLDSAKQALVVLEKDKESLSDSAGKSIKSFLKTRGLYILEAIGAVILVLVVFSILHKLLVRFIPGFRAAHRSFRTRFIDLSVSALATVLAVAAPFVVFLIEEDWVFFSIGLLALLAFLWSMRNAIPDMFFQARLLLNLGPVREGERIVYKNIPWRVNRINTFSQLENPVSGLKARVPIEDLVNLVSYPEHKNEPWFPCKRDDWLILADGYRGKVVGIAPEFIEMVDRGGTKRIFPMMDFLSLNPENISTNFRIKEVIGIDYKHQAQSTNTILLTLEKFMQERLEQEGYADKTKNLRVEFAKAGDSSLDIVVIADFDGELAPIYNRLRRAIQRWCVDACSQYDWEIPFPQLSVHQS